MLKLTKWLSIATIFSLTIVTPSFADVLVTPSNMGSWTFSFLDNNFNSCTNCQVGQIVTGPATPPLGVGSANLSTTPGNGGGASTIGSTGLNGTLLSELTALTYSTYDTTNNGSQFPFLRIHITYTNTLNNDGAGSDSLFFEPPYQTPSTGNGGLPDQGLPVLNTWQTWNALAGGWWTNNGLGGSGGTSVVSFSTIENFYIGATISGSSYFANDGISLTVGEANPGDNFNGYVDNVTVGVNSANTTYNFEPDAAVPEPGSILLLVTVVLGITFTTRRKLFKA